MPFLPYIKQLQNLSKVNMRHIQSVVAGIVKIQNGKIFVTQISHVNRKSRTCLLQIVSNCRA